MAVRNVLEHDYDDRRDYEKEVRERSGQVKTTLDLSMFTWFTERNRNTKGRLGKWITVNKTGTINISAGIGCQLPTEVKMAFLLNKKGTILVMKPDPNGLLLRKSTKSPARLANCAALRNKLIECGIKIPAKFTAEWDEELRAWVGRLDG